MKKILKLIAGVIMTGLLLSTSAAAKESPTQNMELNTTNGEIIKFTITEKGFMFDKYKGKKAVILDFFGPHCPPCLMEIPHLIELQKKHKDTLQIIGIQVQTQMSNDDLNAFIKEKGINYPVVNLDYAWDLVGFARANTGWQGQIPYMMVFDKKGNITRQFIGMVPNETLLKYAK
ncbi:MAG TPA: TlpA family protein disulfide reductase [Campylobacteraceae bacterium]|jgi:thiol-disulfide isomerase/thioredoxin|nr:TlpA family protein disulfide reductase [Campylobacteraceae bacterium]